MVLIKKGGYWGDKLDEANRYNSTIAHKDREKIHTDSVQTHMHPNKYTGIITYTVLSVY